MNKYNPNDLRLAVEYAESAKFKAKVHPNGTIEFDRSPYPEDISEEVAKQLDFCADVYQYAAFNGDFERSDEDGHTREFNSPMEGLNFSLDHYKYEFVMEVKKMLEIENPVTGNRYAMAMVNHADEMKELGRAQAQASKG